MATKIIKRNLPIDTYKIIGTTSYEDGIICDNCGKLIKNIAIVQRPNGYTYYVGLDCAATLSGIKQEDIDFWNEPFNQAKRIRAAIRKYQKVGGYLYVGNKYYNTEQIEISLTKKPNPTILGDYYCHFYVTEDFIQNYLPELVNICKVNKNFTALKEDEIIVNNSGDTYNGYTFYFGIKTNVTKKIIMDKEYEFSTDIAYAEMWKDGIKVAEGTNGGKNIAACQKECVRIYNQYTFAIGQKKLEKINK